MYGTEPEIIGEFDLDCREMMFYMYLPIKMPFTDFRIPERLRIFKPLIDAIRANETDYIYLTAKHLFVTPENMGNRHGWHSDGFGTDDVNYIWTDKFPTEFCVQDFNLSTDCELSMMQMEFQADKKNIQVYKPKTLLRLDQFQIHRVPLIKESGLRTFVKISISEQKYNLVGNSHNFLFDYDWEMKERECSRNHPVK